MATMFKEVDAVVIGMGRTGSILARELTKAGLNVVGLERGPNRTPREGPTGPLGALAYWTAEAITKTYLKNPGPLVPA